MNILAILALVGIISAFFYFWVLKDNGGDDK